MTWHWLAEVIPDIEEVADTLPEKTHVAECGCTVATGGNHVHCQRCPSVFSESPVLKLFEHNLEAHPEARARVLDDEIVREMARRRRQEWRVSA